MKFINYFFIHLFMQSQKEPLYIGDYNLFEVGTIILSSNIGNNCNFQPRGI